MWRRCVKLKGADNYPCWNDIYLLSEVLGMLMLLLLLLLVLLLILLLFLLLRIPFECYAQDRGVIYDMSRPD